VPNALKYGSLSLLGPSGPVQACNGIAFTVNGGAKSMVIKTPVYEKMCLNVISLVLVIGAKLPPHVILYHKTMPKEQMSTGIIVTCQPKD